MLKSPPLPSVTLWRLSCGAPPCIWVRFLLLCSLLKVLQTSCSITVYQLIVLLQRLDSPVSCCISLAEVCLSKVGMVVPGDLAAGSFRSCLELQELL